jgi:hypothetical protein
MLSGDSGNRESRPVRKVMSKAKRAEITENFENNPDDAKFDFDAVVDTKVFLMLI